MMRMQTLRRLDNRPSSTTAGRLSRALRLCAHVFPYSATAASSPPTVQARVCVLLGLLPALRSYVLPCDVRTLSLFHYKHRTLVLESYGSVRFLFFLLIVFPHM